MIYIYINNLEKNYFISHEEKNKNLRQVIGIFFVMCDIPLHDYIFMLRCIFCELFKEFEVLITTQIIKVTNINILLKFVDWY